MDQICGFMYMLEMSYVNEEFECHVIPHAMHTRGFTGISVVINFIQVMHST